jgi:hypothetical protein
MKLYEPRQVESSLYELSLNLYKPEFLFMLCSFNKWVDHEPSWSLAELIRVEHEHVY